MLFFPLMPQVMFTLVVILMETVWEELAGTFLTGSIPRLVLSLIGLLLMSGALYLMMFQRGEDRRR